jgi:hypothetical protein
MRLSIVKKFIDKIEYVSPEIKVIVIGEDIITNSFLDGELDTMDEIPLDKDN